MKRKFGGILLCAVLSVVAAVGWVACSPKKGALSWDASRQNLSLQPGQERLECAFAFKNTSEKTIKILSVVPDCSCILSPLKEATVAPGESGQVPVTFVVGARSGKVKKSLQVFTDASPQPDLLEMHFNVPVLIDIAPRLLYWKKGEVNAPRKIKISMKDQPYRILRVEAVNRAFQTELKTLKAEREYEIVVQPKDTQQARSTELIIQTDSPHASWNYLVCQLRVE